jgi:hypothetical protein
VPSTEEDSKLQKIRHQEEVAPKIRRRCIVSDFSAGSALARILDDPSLHFEERQRPRKPKRVPKTRRPHDAAPDPEVFLTSRGWKKTEVEIQRNGPNRVYRQITWWKKNGREYAQHFAVWLEKSKVKV